MKTKHYIIISLILLTLVFFLGRSCAPEQKPTDKTAEVKKDIAKTEAEIAILKPLGERADSVRIITKWKYKTLHDTIPCEIKLVYCDSVIYRDSISINYKDSTITKYDSLVPKYKLLARLDSTTIDSLTRSRKKFWKGFKVGFVLGAFTGAVGAGSVGR